MGRLWGQLRWKHQHTCSWLVAAYGFWIRRLRRVTGQDQPCRGVHELCHWQQWELTRRTRLNLIWGLTILGFVGLPSSSSSICVLIWNFSSNTAVDTCSFKTRFLVLACLDPLDQITITGSYSSTGTLTILICKLIAISFVCELSTIFQFDSSMIDSVSI